MARQKRKKTIRRRRASPRRKHDAISRAILGREVKRQLQELGLTREAASRLLDEYYSQISRLMAGHFTEFSADRLVRMLNLLGSDVAVEIRHARRLGRRGKTKIRSSLRLS